MDTYLTRRRAPGYDCLSLADEVWSALTGESLREKIRHRSFVRLAAPADPCIVFMRGHRREPHVGVYLRGRVLHLRECAPEFTQLRVASFGFPTVEFFR